MPLNERGMVDKMVGNGCPDRVDCSYKLKLTDFEDRRTQDPSKSNIVASEALSRQGTGQKSHSFPFSPLAESNYPGGERTVSGL